MVWLPESKIIKAFFDGNFADEVITTPRTKKHTDIDERETAIHNKLHPTLTGEQLKLFTSSLTSKAIATRAYMKATIFAVFNSACALP